MTGIQLAAVAGALLAAGVVLAVWYVQPATPALSSALERLAAGPTNPASVSVAGPVEVVGGWVANRLPSGWVRPPAADLAVLGKTMTRFYGEKTVAALMGLVAAPLLCVFAPAVGLPVPLVVSPLMSVTVAVGLWFLPDRDVARSARTARVEFNHALTRLWIWWRWSGGPGPDRGRRWRTPPGSVPATRVFDRIADGMARAEVSGRLPWMCCRSGPRPRPAPVDDLAEIMRLAELQTVPVYDTLRQHNAAPARPAHRRAGSGERHQPEPGAARRRDGGAAGWPCSSPPPCCCSSSPPEDGTTVDPPTGRNLHVSRGTPAPDGAASVEPARCAGPR